MNWLRHFSIRVRLTIGALVIAVAFFAGTAVVVRHQVETILRNSSVMLLQSDADPYQQRAAAGESAELDTPAQGQLIAVVDASGNVLQSSLPTELTPQIPALADAGPATQDVRTAAAQYSVISRAVTTPDGVWHVVAARNEGASTLSLNNLTTALVLGLIILTLLFGVAAWVLASAALRPVSAMQRTAIALRSSTSNELLPVGPARDELAALAVTLNELIARLRASAEREKQLVSDASHELRTPLAILQTQLELAHLSTGDADALIGEIESAERTVKRLSTLAASLLELTRIEGMTTSDRTPVLELVDELVESIDRARMLTIGSSVIVDYDIAGLEAVTGVARLSPHNFGRVLDNLLGNAISAVGESGTVRADLAVVAGAAGDGVVGGAGSAGGHSSGLPWLRLEISDTGPGMAPDFMPLAFDRFAREDEARTSASPLTREGLPRAGGQKGAGLGLSIVNALVTSSGGTISIANRVPHGFSVVVSVPVTASAAGGPVVRDTARATTRDVARDTARATTRDTARAATRDTARESERRAE